MIKRIDLVLNEETSELEYCATLDGELVGYYRTRLVTERELDRIAFELLADQADDQADQDAVVLERAWQAHDRAMCEHCTCYATGTEQPACLALGYCADEQARNDLAALLVELATEADEESERKAYKKAADNITRGLSLQRGDNCYLVPSGTTTGVVYVTTLNSCSCHAGIAGRHCWHKALVNAIALQRHLLDEYAAAWPTA
jgi:hypothetical protein